MNTLHGEPVTHGVVSFVPVGGRPGRLFARQHATVNLCALSRVNWETIVRGFMSSVFWHASLVVNESSNTRSLFVRIPHGHTRIRGVCPFAQGRESME